MLISVVVASGKEFISSKLISFLVVDRMSEREIEDYFSYAMLLFKDGAMRNSIKAKLKNPLLKDVSSSEPLPSIFRSIADGGAILVLCNFIEITLLHAGRPATLL